MKNGTMKKAGSYYIVIYLAVFFFAGTPSFPVEPQYENWQDIKASYLRIKLKGTIELDTADVVELDRIANIGKENIEPYCRGLYARLSRDLEEFRSKDSDNDRLSDILEKKYKTNPDDDDTDKDRLKDGDEVYVYKTNPADSDSDGDGLQDGDEVDFGSDPNKADSDSDRLNDSLEFFWKIDPNNKDSDGDGLEDGAEVWDYNTRPDTSDSDGDYLNDSLELFQYFTDPNNPDSDNDRLWDGDEINVTGTNPNNPDSDDDNLWDGFEKGVNADPNNPDTDGDGLLDGNEVNYGLRPDTSDTDGDGINDYKEVNIWGADYAIDPEKPGENERNELKPHLDWAINTGLVPESGSIYQRALAIDKMGNCYFANRFKNDVELATYLAAKKVDSTSIHYEIDSKRHGIIVAKRQPGEVYPWAHKLYSGNNLIAVGIAVDSLNNCYLAGNFKDRFVIDDSIKIKGKGLNCFLIKFDHQGKYVWHRILNMPGRKSGKVFCQDIQADNNHNLYISGGFRGTLKLNDSIFIESYNKNKNDIFIAKLDSSGAPLWIAKAGGGGDHDMAHAMAVDKDGNIAITGQVGSEVVVFSSAIPGGTVDSATTKESEDIFVVKYDSNGKYLWNAIAGGKENDKGKDVCFDSNGYIYIAANFQGELYIRKTKGPRAIKLLDIVIVKFDSDGEFVRYSHFGGRGNVDVHSIVADEKNDIYIAGDFTKTLTAKGTRMNPVTSKGQQDGFVLKINQDGQIIWDPIRFGEEHDGSLDIEGGEGATCIAVDQTGDHIYISGYFSGRSKIGDIELESIRYSNFLSRLNRGKLGK